MTGFCRKTCPRAYFYVGYLLLFFRLINSWEHRMSHFDVETISDISNIGIFDICGLWEVIRISRENCVNPLYPWVENRFKYSFQPEMFFLCLQDGQVFRGTWELSEKTYETQRRYSIILNETFEYTILDLSEDDLTLSDHINKYLLVRRL